MQKDIFYFLLRSQMPESAKAEPGQSRDPEIQSWIHILEAGTGVLEPSPAGSQVVH